MNQGQCHFHLDSSFYQQLRYQLNSLILSDDNVEVEKKEYLVVTICEALVAPDKLTILIYIIPRFTMQTYKL